MRAHPALLREPRLTFLTAALAAAAVAGAAGFGGSAVIGWCGPVDRPGPRTSHGAPTATSGGLAVVCGAALGLLAWALLSPPGPGPEAGAVLDLRTGRGVHGPQTLLTAAWATGFAMLGAADDLRDLSARLKLAVMAVAALAYAVVVTPVASLALGALAAGGGDAGLVLGCGGVALGVLVTVNAVNFMDGADGLATGAMAVAFAALGVGLAFVARPLGAGLALAAAAALAGLLPWNLGGRLFQGDAGALFCGSLFAGLCATGHAGLGWLFGPTVLLPLLVDVALTLGRRALARRRLMQAHREHLYQRWLQATGRSHAALAVRMWALVAAAAALALGGVLAGSLGQTAAFAAGLGLAVFTWTAVSRRVDARLAAQGAAARDGGADGAPVR